MMKVVFYTLLIHILSFFTVAPCSDQDDQVYHIKQKNADSVLISYEMVYDQIINLKPLENSVADIEDLIIPKDVAQFKLEQGKLYLISPICGRNVAALFIGKGIFSFYPPTQIERDQLYRYYERTEMDQEFNMLFFICADNTIDMIKQRYPFKEGHIPRNNPRFIKKCIEYLVHEDNEEFNKNVMYPFLQNETNAFFYAHFCEKEFEPMFFVVDPYNDEEIRFMRRKPSHYTSRTQEMVCQFDRMEDYIIGQRSKKEEKDIYQIHHYQIQSTITDDYDFSAITEITFKLLKPGYKWISFLIFSEIVVDSAFWQNGMKVKYFKKEDSPTLRVYLEPSNSIGPEYQLTLYYHGDLIEKDMESMYIKSFMWYPRNDKRHASATFDMTFQVPNNLDLIAVGENISSRADGERVISRWITQQPVRHVAFNIGHYKAFDIEHTDIPPIKIYMSKYRHDLRGYPLGPIHIEGLDDMETYVGIDIVNSFHYFQSLFGKPPIKRLIVVETPYAHGVAYPGLINLGWFTFLGTNIAETNQVFRAHEVAHQWWGIAVDFESYHDQWLSEGLATFCGLWYLQKVLNQNQKYFDILTEWEEDLINLRKYPLADGREAAPIWLGYRTISDKTLEDFNLIIYKKGAWVLHMIRNMMLDLNDISDVRFRKMLQDLYNAYQGKSVSTKAFQDLLEKHMGEKMDWFIKQWIYDNDIPEYKYSYKIIEDIKPGKYSVILKIEQLNVDENFRAYFPVCINLPDNQKYRTRIPVKGPITNFTIPNLPSRPEDVIFNEFKSVLCNEEYVDWED